MKELREKAIKKYIEANEPYIEEFDEGGYLGTDTNKLATYINECVDFAESIQPQATVTDELKRLILICAKEGGNQAYAHLYFELRGVLDKLQQPQEQNRVSKELDDLLTDLMLNLGSRIADNEIIIKNAGSFIDEWKGKHLSLEYYSTKELMLEVFKEVAPQEQKDSELINEIYCFIDDHESNHDYSISTDSLKVFIDNHQQNKEDA